MAEPQALIRDIIAAHPGPAEVFEGFGPLVG